MRRIKISLVLAGSLLAVGCSTYTTPRYSISADSNVALKALGMSNISVGSFAGPNNFDTKCRAVGPLSPPDGLTHTAYIKKALEDELKVAGVYVTSSPKTTLTGTVTRLAFSSARGLTGGTWEIDMTVNSSNGKTLSVSERYDFESGFNGEVACKNTADAYMPAVQNLIGRLVRATEFKGLVQ